MIIVRLLQQLIVLILLSGTTAHSQQILQPADLVTEAKAEEIRRYSVELIIFEYSDGNAGGSEVFLPDEPPPAENLPADFALQMGNETFAEETDDIADLPLVIDSEAVAPGEQATAEFSAEELILSEIPGAQQIGLKLIDPSDYSLDEIYRKLVQLDAYTPLMRTAWTQIPIEEEETRPIRLRRLGDPPLKLDGNVTLYLGRYLHLVLDLALEERATKAQTDPDVDYRYYGDNRTGYEYDPYGTRRAGPVFYRIQEDRIVRNGELRYYDHPKFGVLAKITRVEEDQLQPGEIAPDADALTSDSNQGAF